MRFYSDKYLLMVIIGGITLLNSALGQVFLAKDEALEYAFPNNAEIQTLNFVLSDQQVAALESLAKTPCPSKIITYFSGTFEDGSTGYAFIDVSKVRTNYATTMTLIDQAGTVKEAVILAFFEPREYLPPDRWLEQFLNQDITSDLRPDRDIHGILGSTLTVRAITGSVARALAGYELLIKPQQTNHKSAG